MISADLADYPDLAEAVNAFKLNPPSGQDCQRLSEPRLITQVSDLHPLGLDTTTMHPKAKEALTELLPVAAIYEQYTDEGRTDSSWMLIYRTPVILPEGDECNFFQQIGGEPYIALGEIAHASHVEYVIDRQNQQQADDARTWGAFGVTSETIGRIQPLEPLIDGWIWQNTLSRVYGAPGTFKSFTVLDMAACVGSGLPWLGQYATKQMPVVLVAAEGSGGLEQRVRAWEVRNQRYMAGVHIVPRPVQLMDDDSFEKLGQYCRYVKAGWLIVDTQAQAFGGVNESDPASMTAAGLRLQEFRDRFGVAVTTTHHTTNAGIDPRGSNAMTAVMQSQIAIGHDGPATVRISNPRQKDHAQMSPVAVSLDQQRVQLSDGRSVSSLVLQPAAVPERVPVVEVGDLVSLVRQYYPAGVTPSEARALAVGQLGVSDSTFWRRWQALGPQMVPSADNPQRYVFR